MEGWRQREALAAQLAETEAAKAAELQAAREEWEKRREALATAEAALSANQTKMQQMRVENSELRECCELLEKRLLMEEEACGKKSDLRALLLENANFKDRGEQLQQNLVQAEAQASASMKQMHSLYEERGMYKERCHQLQRQLDEAKRQSIRSQAGICLHPTLVHRDERAASSQESNSNMEMDYIPVDDGTSSVLSNSSWFSVKPHSFMLDAIFKTRSYVIDFFVMGKDLLKKGSQVVAADNETILEVAEPPKVCEATEVVHLQAAAATLDVTPDHRVQVPDANGELDIGLFVPAGELKEGDLVALDSVEPVALTSVEIRSMDVHVLKLTFKPDLPVAAFACPACILSKSDRKKPATRRGGMCHKSVGTSDKTADGGVSVPITAGEYMD